MQPQILGHQVKRNRTSQLASVSNRNSVLREHIRDFLKSKCEGDIPWFYIVMYIKCYMLISKIYTIWSPMYRNMGVILISYHIFMHVMRSWSSETLGIRDHWFCLNLGHLYAKHAEVFPNFRLFASKTCSKFYLAKMMHVLFQYIFVYDILNERCRN